VIAVTACLLAPSDVSAESAGQYANTIQRAESLVQLARGGDQQSLDEAIRLLDQTDVAQPEILSELRRTPPDLKDASDRLAALADALSARPDTPDPERARAHLNRILSMPRYAGLDAPPSIIDRFLGWVRDQLLRLLAELGMGSFVMSPSLFVAAALITLLVVLIFLALRLRSSRRTTPGAVPAPNLPDFFAEADRLASAGRYTEAVRLLARAVAGRLTGQRAWEESGLTVREIYAEANAFDRLAPLLLPFEETVYGHHPLDQAGYSRARTAALAFQEKAA
jgi:hypothetical protein